MTPISRRSFGLACAALAASSAATSARGELLASTSTNWRQKLTPEQKRRLVVPGMGPRVNKTGDDFEDPSFVYYPQHPKSSWNIDKEVNLPGSYSSKIMPRTASSDPVATFS